MIAVKSGQRTDAIGRKKFAFVEQVTQYADELIFAGNCQHAALSTGVEATRYGCCKLRPIGEIPFEPVRKHRKLLHKFVVESFHRKKWDESDHGTYLQHAAAGLRKNLVV